MQKKTWQEDWVEVYDASLREGKQAMGVNLRLNALIALITELIELGVDAIEVGWPGASKAWDALFEAIAAGRVQKPLNCKFAAFGSTHRARKTVKSDELFQKLLVAPVDIITIFGKCWEPHITGALQTTVGRNLEMVRDSMAAIVQSGKRGIFDAEHFFQGYLDGSSEYALEVLEAALAGGATTLALCDTNGIAYPWQVEQIVKTVVDRFGDRALIGLHMHGDRGLALANTLTGLRVGARHCQGTINGCSERVSMACTLEVAANLHLLSEDQGEPWARISPHFQPGLLTQVSREMDAWSGLHPHQRKAFVGRCSSTHKAGVHVSAGTRAGYEVYESHNPARFGRRRHIVLSSMAGGANIIAFAQNVWRVDLIGQSALINQILNRIEEQEAKGYSFDSCSGSAALIVAESFWPNCPQFDLQRIQVSIDGTSLATVRVDNQYFTNEGNGPVDALFKAALRALAGDHSCLKSLGLNDYRPYTLRVEGHEGTASIERVEIDWVHPDFGSFTTQGVSGNIIEASWEAIVEAIKLTLVYQWRSESVSE